MTSSGSTPSPSLWRDVRRWLPGVIISVIALFAIFRMANWSELVSALSSFKGINLGIAIVFSVASLSTRGAAWRTLLGGKASFRQCFFIVNEGYLLNNIFPFRAGEFARAVFMGQSSGLGPYHVLSTIVIERIFDLAMAALLVLASLPLALGMDWARPVAIGALALVIIAMAFLFLMARYNSWVKCRVETLAERYAFVKRAIVPRFGSLMAGLETLTNPGQFLKALFWIFVSWVIWVSTHFVMIRAIAPQAPFWWAAFADGILALGAAVPSAPASLGVFEAALVGALTLLGVSYNSAVAYAIVMHFLNFFSTGIFGFWGLMRDQRSISDLVSQIQIKKKIPAEK